MVDRSRYRIILRLVFFSYYYRVVESPIGNHFFFFFFSSRYICILKLPTGSCGLDDAASFTRVSDTWCGAHCFPFFFNSLPRISVSDTVRARAHNHSTHAHVQTCSFWTLEERGGESLCLCVHNLSIPVLQMRGFYLRCHCCCPKLRKTSSGPDGTM